MMKEALLKFGIVEALDPVLETAAERTSRKVRAALQFTWATMSAYLVWRTYSAWDQTHAIGCTRLAAISTTMLLAPIGGIAVAIAHINRHLAPQWPHE